MKGVVSRRLACSNSRLREVDRWEVLLGNVKSSTTSCSTLRTTAACKVTGTEDGNTWSRGFQEGDSEALACK